MGKLTRLSVEIEELEEEVRGMIKEMVVRAIQAEVQNLLCEGVIAEDGKGGYRLTKKGKSESIKIRQGMRKAPLTILGNEPDKAS